MHHKKASYKVLSFQGNRVVKWHFIIMMNGGMAKVESFSFNDPENGIHFSISRSDKWLECFFKVNFAGMYVKLLKGLSYNVYK